MKQLIVSLPAAIPDTRCVFAIKCGPNIYIGKTSNLEWLANELKTTYGKYHRLGIPEGNLYYPLIKCYTGRKDVKRLEIEVLFASDNGYDILKFELEQLEMHFGQKYCLNKNNIPHLPKTVANKKGSNWLTENERLNFQKLLSKYTY